MRSRPFVSRFDGKSFLRGLRAISAGTLLAWLTLQPASGQTDGSTGSAGETGGIGSTGSTGDTGSGGGPAPTLGYNPLSNTIDPGVNTFYSFVSGSTTGTAFVVPFQVNGLGSGYSLASVSLLIGGPGATFNGVSLSVYATLPTSFAAPTALTTFSTTQPGSSPGTAPGAFTFNATSSPTLSAGTTYYLRIGYTGPDTLNWARTGSLGTGSGDIPALTFIDGSFATNTFITYRQVDSSGFTDGYDNIGGFSITANAVSAIPEPATSATMFSAAALLAGLVARWKRRTSAPPPPTTAEDVQIAE